MVAASRKERPSPVDVRYLVRAELESQLRSGSVGEDQEADWINALINLFNPGFVKLGVAAAFTCMLVLSGTPSAENVDLDPDYADPLANAYSGDAEWSDWL